MSTKTPREIAADNGKPTKGPPAPVIRRAMVNEEDTASRVMNRHVPAWVISGGFHVLIIGVFVLFWNVDKPLSGNQDDKIVTTKVPDKEERDENLTNTDLGFDPDLEAATQSPREEMENVEGPTAPDEPIGSPSETMEQPTQTFAPPGLGPTDQLNGALSKNAPDGSVKPGEMGGGSNFATQGMKGRTGATKNKLLKEGGGNTETEAAVAKGLAWLAKQQKSDGRWVYDGSSTDEIAATGMALLPFLAAGITHKTPGDVKYKDYPSVVAKGVAWLSGKQKSDGSFTGAGTMYSHGIASITLCEAYGMTKDPNIKDRAQKAINFIMSKQGKDGSWGYSPGTNGDTSIVGWQVQALRSGRTAELTVDQKKMDLARDFLVSVSTESESQYGYASKGGTPTLSAVGLLCRQYMGMGPQNPSLAKGVEYLKKQLPVETNWDMYYYYYATQVMHFFGGPVWDETWNPAMKAMLIKLQEKAGANSGRWPKDNSHIGTSCGHIGTTCLALLTLEVYYRHLPLYKRGTGGLDDLEK